MTLWDLAQRFVGQVVEIPGPKHSPFIQWCHESCGLDGETPDEVPWCSSFINRLAWILRLPRSKSARARSWLHVGIPIPLEDALIGDVVILNRGRPPQPGPSVIKAPGHVGLYAGVERGFVLVLGGNQGDQVTIAPYSQARVLGVRRLS